MTHVLNSPESFKEDVLDGMARAYPHLVERIPGAFGVRAAGTPVPGRVSVLIGGGLGHLPGFAGLVGPGLATGAVLGDVFTSPSDEQVLRCTKAVDGGAGVIYSYGNYSGDVMNFDLAAERAAEEGIDVHTVLVTDDVAAAPRERIADRRGIAGGFCVYKVLGAAAAAGMPVTEVVAAGRRANDLTRTIGVAFRGCTLPGSQAPLFTVAPDRMELGLGIHGEPGIETIGRLDARSLATLMVDRLLADAPSDAGGSVAVLVNGLGSTTHEELFVLFGAVSRSLDAAGLEVRHCDTGELVTSLDMAGCSITLMWLDDQIAQLYEAPATSIGYRSVLR